MVKEAKWLVGLYVAHREFVALHGELKAALVVT